MSGWIASLTTGDSLSLKAPHGDFVYSEDLRDRPLVLIGTGVGGGAILGLARDAIALGHVGPIEIYHGARRSKDLYLAEEFAALRSDEVQVIQRASTEPSFGGPAGRVTDVVFSRREDLSDAALFVCGHPDVVETCRIQGVAAGATPALIHDDVYESGELYQPRDSQKLGQIAPDPELWAALDEGRLLTTILTEFYTLVFDDPLLAPFFHRSTKARAIEKQYSFLQDIFTGTKRYFGEKPFNAHHWMVITDALFDYREAMLFDVVRKHGLPEDAIRRWAALHETFRREIVKSTARGVRHGETEVFLEGFSHIKLDVSSVCDGCQNEVVAGQYVTTHNRTGEVYCPNCDGKAIGQSVHNEESTP